MRKILFSTDQICDFPEGYVEKHNIMILPLTYSIDGDTATYTPKDYYYKNQAHNFLGASNLLKTTGPQAGQPKFEINANGHLILSL